MKEKSLTELTDLESAEVSLVTRGANLKKRFPIFKQQEDDSMTPEAKEILKAVLETEVDSESSFIAKIRKAGVSENGIEALKSALRILEAFKDELPQDALAQLAAAAGMPPLGEEPEVPAEEVPEETEEAKAKKSQEAATDLAQKEKNMEAISKAQSEIDGLKKSLKDERDARETEEWIRKAETELSHFPGKSAKDLGIMLKKMHDADPETAKSQFESMKSASEALKSSHILKTAGATGTGYSESSAEAKIEQLASGIVEKSADVRMTKEKAVALVLKRDPNLYKQYLDEHPAQRAASHN